MPWRSSTEKRVRKVNAGVVELSMKYFIIFLLLFSAVISPVKVVLGSELETSITSLTLRSEDMVVYTDSFFELVDMGGYILIPVEALAGQLHLSLVYQPEQGILTVKQLDGNQSIRVDYKNGVYLDRMDWSKEAPVELEGKFFVTTRLIQELTGMRVEWDGKLQELTIVGNFSENKADVLPASLTNTEEKHEEAVLPEVRGPDYALDAASYKISFAARANAKDGDRLDGELQLNLHGRAKDWQITWGADVPLTPTLTADQELSGSYQVSEIQGKYSVNNQLLILGDSTVDFPQFMAKKLLRGIYYTYPARTFSPVVAYTTLTGQTEAGNKLTLYVNQLKRETITVKEGAYTFSQVPLIINRLNLIKIVIEDARGELSTVTRQFAGSPDILPVGTRYVKIAGGWYGDVDSTVRNRALGALATDWSLSEAVSMHLATLGRTLEAGKGGIAGGANLSLALRTDNATTLSLNWICGGAWQTTGSGQSAEEWPTMGSGQSAEEWRTMGRGQSAEGWQTMGNSQSVDGRHASGMATSVQDQKAMVNGVSADLLYCLERGYIKARAFYIPEEIAQGIRVATGQGFTLDGALDIGSHWTASGRGWQIQPIANTRNFAVSSGVKASVSGKFGARWQNALAINGGYEQTSLIGEESRNMQKASIEFKHALAGKRVTAKGALKLTAAATPVAEDRQYLNATQEQNPKSLKTPTAQIDRTTSLLAEETLSVLCTKQILGSLTGNLSANWLNNRFFTGSLSLEGETRLSLDKLWLSLDGKLSGVHNQVTNVTRLEKAESELAVQHFLDNDNCLNFNLGCSFERSTGTTCLKAGIAGSHYLTADQGKFTWNLDYASPSGSRTTAQWPFKLELTQQLPSELELKIKIENSYSTLLEPTAEKVFTVSIAHSLGFAQGVIQGQKRAAGTQSSFIGGIVYLDQNGNGQMDSGEKTLPQIKMALDGRRAVTDDTGKFRFDYLEPGVYKLGFDLKSLNADYLPVTGDRAVRLREGENMWLSYGVTMGGSVSGKVFLDKNANGQMDVGEEPLRLVGLELDGGKKVLYTNKDGTFYFENLPLGQHTLRIVTDTLPAQTGVLQANCCTFVISEGALDVKDCVFPVAFKFFN